MAAVKSKRRAKSEGGLKTPAFFRSRVAVESSGIDRRRSKLAVVWGRAMADFTSGSF